MNSKTNTTVAHELYCALREDLLEGRIGAGDRLRLDPLAKRLEVSRTAARESLMRLVGEGLVTFSPQRGFTVTTVSPDKLSDLTLARIVIETGALRESIRRGDIGWESAVLAAHHTMAGTPVLMPDGTSNIAWPVAHDNFHSALLAGAGSTYLSSVALRLRELVQFYPHWNPDAIDIKHRDIAAEHREIMQLAIARDEDAAAAALGSHLELTAATLLAIAEEAHAAPVED